MNEILKKSSLFSDMSDDEIKTALECIALPSRSVKKGETIVHAGEKVLNIGFIVSGGVIISKEDYWGNRVIMAKLIDGQIFSESFALSKSKVSEVCVVAAEESNILFLDAAKILMCKSEVAHKLIKNLVFALAGKNLRLNDKLTHMSKPTTREKLLSYLSAESQKQKSSTFEIPFDREQLADYLAVERSAMSRELSKLRCDGYIQYTKNRFTLMKNCT